MLDLSSGRLSDSITHAEQALESVEARLAELRNAVNGQMKVESLQKPDSKGKGKAAAKGPRLLGDDAISTMTQAQMTSEIKELEGLKEDLALKVRAVAYRRNFPITLSSLRLRSSRRYRTSQRPLRLSLWRRLSMRSSQRDHQHLPQLPFR